VEALEDRLELLAQVLQMELGVVDHAPQLRQYQRMWSLPARAACSITRPTEFAGRCVECGTPAGSRNSSPGGSAGRAACVLDHAQDNVAFAGKQLSVGYVVIVALVGPPTTITMKPLFQIILLPTGGLSRCRFSSTQRAG